MITVACGLVAATAAAVVLISGSGPGSSQAVAAPAAASSNPPMNRVTATSLAAFRAASPGAIVTTAQVAVGPLSRSYLVIAPATAHGPLPVLVVLSGSDEDVVSEAIRDQFVPLAQDGQAILVYPSPYTIDLTWNAETDTCCQLAGSQDIPDASFITHLVPVLKAELRVSQVDLIGFSNGGKLAFTLACQNPALFGAVAVVAAVPLNDCSAPGVPVLIALGSLDDREPLADARSPESATVQLQDAIAYWRQRDGCTITSSALTVGVATITRWAECAGSTRVTQVLWSGVEHIWPRTNDVGVDAAAVTLVWSFLSAQK